MAANGYELDPATGCHLWTGSQNSGGYGTEWRGGKGQPAHIAAWERHHGKALPSDRVLDHLCRRRLCVRPEHLEAVSVSENLRRRDPKHRARTMTHCPAGHDLFSHGRRTQEGGEVCLTCSGVRRPGQPVP